MVYSIIISSCFGKKRNIILLILDLYWSTDNPLVISILDGSTLRLLFEDEDDFAMLAENLFTDLDVEDKGKISKSQIRNALVQMGVDMGVPPFSGSLYFWAWRFFFFFCRSGSFLFPTESASNRYLMVVLCDVVQCCLFISLLLII